MRGYILDANGEPRLERNTLKWAVWFKTADDARKVAKTNVNGYEVSTVFLGVDHNYSGVGPPVLWETMVFGPDMHAEDVQERYSSLADAKAGHARIVAQYQIRTAIPVDRSSGDGPFAGQGDGVQLP